MGGLIDVIESSGVLGTVKKVAPLLAGVLGSPLAGVAVSLLAGAFGTDPKNIGDLAQAIQSPEAALKIKTVEYEHAEMLAKIASTDYSIEVDDRKDARSHAIDYKDFMKHMAYFVTFGFFGALLMMFVPIQFNGNERELLSMLVGMLASKWQTIIDFFYGSSRTQGATKTWTQSP
jgi:hypothetical protein